MKYRYLIGDFWSLGHEITTYLRGFWSLGHEISTYLRDFWSLPWVPELESVFNWDVLCLITQIAARALKTMQESSLPPPPPIAA
jgi:hypothetical protein